MINKCVVVGCRSGYESQKKKYDKDNSESVSKDTKVPIFGFPFNKPDLNLPVGSNELIDRIGKLLVIPVFV